MTASLAATQVGVGRFLHGSGALGQLAAEIEAAGGRPFIIGGRVGLDLVSSALPANRVAVVRHEAPCTRAAAQHHARHAAAAGAGVVVGVGGGVTIDLAKAAATLAGLPVIAVPTSIATCVAASSVCIMYAGDGRPDGALSMTRGIFATLADRDVIQSAPRRLLLAGILDTMAKLPELRHPAAGRPGPRDGLAKATALAVSAQVYGFLAALAPRLAGGAPLSAGQLDEATLCNLLLTGIVSGLCAGNGQLAIAHSFYDWVRREVPQPQPVFLHGEIVGVGILMQKMFNGEDESELRLLMRGLGLPTSISELDIAMTAARWASLQTHLVRTTRIDPADARRLSRAIRAHAGEVPS